MKEMLISQDENGEWIVTNEMIPGFIARGKTQREAIDKMKQALSIYFPCGDCKESK
jgi:predicted RNase H-like HicB family nuclease